MASKYLKEKAETYVKQFGYELEGYLLDMIKEAYISGAKQQAEFNAQMALVDMEDASTEMLSYSWGLAQAIRNST